MSRRVTDLKLHEKLNESDDEETYDATGVSQSLSPSQLGGGGPVEGSPSPFAVGGTMSSNGFQDTSLEERLRNWDDDDDETKQAQTVGNASKSDFSGDKIMLQQSVDKAIMPSQASTQQRRKLLKRAAPEVSVGDSSSAYAAENSDDDSVLQSVEQGEEEEDTNTGGSVKRLKARVSVIATATAVGVDENVNLSNRFPEVSSRLSGSPDTSLTKVSKVRIAQRSRVVDSDEDE